MGRMDHDVIVVGARCAGAALATFLARRGVDVLLLERSSAGSEQVLSTHLVHPAGMKVLDELGVGDAVRAGDALATIHARDAAGLDAGRRALDEAVRITDEAPAPLPLVSHRVTAAGVEVLAS